MQAGSEPLVSIVTPVYNEAKYLQECIESVLGQTYQNWEYTILDNCSKDGSLDIAQRYAAMDRRIRVCRNSTLLPAIPNHNAALRLISPASEYCKVVFGDDLIFPECLERMVELGERHPTAGIIGSYYLEGERVMCAGLPHTTELVSGADVCRRHLLERLYLWGSANSVLYRARLVRSRDPFYNEAHIHSDTEVCFELLRGSDFGFVHQVLSFTRPRPGSLNTVSMDRGTDVAAMLYLMSTYGPVYLAPEEKTECVQDHLKAYYRYLGKKWLLGRDKAFWELHRGQMAEAGVRLSRLSVIWGALAEVGKAVVTPNRAISALRKERGSKPHEVRHGVAAS